LGLSIARRIVEAHHGNILVDSAPEKGSRFQIFLPFKAAEM
jgi:two-component system phosphate regulon sensor histidine kinase PhoR